MATAVATHWSVTTPQTTSCRAPIDRRWKSRAVLRKTLQLVLGRKRSLGLELELGLLEGFFLFEKKKKKTCEFSFLLFDFSLSQYRLRKKDHSPVKTTRAPAERAAAARETQFRMTPGLSSSPSPWSLEKK